MWSLTSQKTLVACDAASWGDNSVRGMWIGVLSEEPSVNFRHLSVVIRLHAH